MQLWRRIGLSIEDRRSWTNRDYDVETNVKTTFHFVRFKDPPVCCWTDDHKVNKRKSDFFWSAAQM